jgi:hypothetical protein
VFPGHGVESEKMSAGLIHRAVLLSADSASPPHGEVLSNVPQSLVLLLHGVSSRLL